MNTIWCNGQWLPAAGFPATPQDRGAQLGLGLFETLLGLDGRAVFAGRHLARLAASCERLGWAAPQAGFDDLAGVMDELLERTGLTTGRARLRLTVSAGSGGLADIAAGPDRLVWLMAVPAAPVPDAVAVTIAPWPRNERGALAGLKCASYAENLLALDHARRAGFAETLFFNTAGELCEAAMANVFIVRNDRLSTPPPSSGCLPGVTRGVLWEIARRAGITCAEERLGPAELAAADEIFLTSATRGPLRVSRIDGRLLAAAPMTTRLRTLWEAEIRRAICR